jgi:hypothetical protein
MQPDKITFKDPHIEERKIGKYPISIHYKIPDKIPRTAVAFSELAKIEYRDQMAQKDGHDNHVASLQKLMDAFDVFIREKFRKKPVTLKNNPTNNEEFTILLLWQIRHILTHNGGIVDDKSKTHYETIIQMHEEMQPLVELPLELKIGEQFIIDYKNYKNARECILNYIQKQVSPEDFHIIKCRGSLVIHQFEGYLSIPFEGGHIILDIAEATMHGFTINVKDSQVIPPENTTYNLEEQ